MESLDSEKCLHIQGFTNVTAAHFVVSSKNPLRHLYLREHSFRHYIRFMTIAEARNKDQYKNWLWLQSNTELHLLYQSMHQSPCFTFYHHPKALELLNLLQCNATYLQHALGFLESHNALSLFDDNCHSHLLGQMKVGATDAAALGPFLKIIHIKTIGINWFYICLFVYYCKTCNILILWLHHQAQFQFDQGLHAWSHAVANQSSACWRLRCKQ